MEFGGKSGKVWWFNDKTFDILFFELIMIYSVGMDKEDSYNYPQQEEEA